MRRFFKRLEGLSVIRWVRKQFCRESGYLKKKQFSERELKQFKRTRTGKKKQESSSEEEHKVDALASGADEGRDKLRKAAGSSKYTEIRRYPNWGTTRMKNPGFLTESIG